MKHNRYIYIGIDEKNNKLYYDKETEQIYERIENAKYDYKQSGAGMGGAIVLCNALHHSYKANTEKFPIEMYIAVSAVLGILLALLYLHYTNKKSNKLFEKSPIYTVTAQK